MTDNIFEEYHKIRYPIRAISLLLHKLMGACNSATLIFPDVYYA